MLKAAMTTSSPTPSFYGPRGEASEEIPSAEQVHEQRRQRRDQNRRTLVAKHWLGSNRGGKRDQRRRYRLLIACRKGDAVQELVPDTGKLEDHGHDQDRRRVQLARGFPKELSDARCRRPGSFSPEVLK